MTKRMLRVFVTFIACAHVELVNRALRWTNVAYTT